MYDCLVDYLIHMHTRDVDKIQAKEQSEEVLVMLETLSNLDTICKREKQNLNFYAFFNFQYFIVYIKLFKIFFHVI